VIEERATSEEEIAGRIQPELALMDVGMPSLTGLDATRRIREQTWGRGMTVIALTGWGQEGDRERSREAGCDGHLVKPVGLAELHRLLAGLPGVQDDGTRPEK
jgi:CheY-like chemotaxis protein